MSTIRAARTSNFPLYLPSCYRDASHTRDAGIRVFCQTGVVRYFLSFLRAEVDTCENGREVRTVSVTTNLPTHLQGVTLTLSTSVISDPSWLAGWPSTNDLTHPAKAEMFSIPPGHGFVPASTHLQKVFFFLNEILMTFLKSGMFKPFRETARP